MTAPMVTKLVTVQSSLLFGGQGNNATPIQVTNLSTTVTVWVDNASNVTNDGNTGVPIGPLASMSFDGSVSIYAIATGGNALLSVVPGGVAYSPGSLAIAGNVNATISGSVNISGQSVPIDVSAATVTIVPNGNGYINPGQTLNLVTDTSVHTQGPGTTYQIPFVDVRKYTSVSLYFQAYASAQNTVGSALTAQVQLSWYDDAAGLYPVYVETVSMYIGNGSGKVQALQGTMPCHGGYLIASVTNNGTAGNIVFPVLILNGSYRTPVYSSWRQSTPSTALTAFLCNGVTVSNLNVPPYNYNNSLGMLPGPTPGTGLRMYLLPLYSGPVYLQYSIITAALTQTPTIVDLAYTTSGNLSGGTGQSGWIWTGPNTAGQSVQQMIELPRSPCALVVNPAATSSIQFSLVGQQGY